MTERKPSVVKNADMSAEMQEYALKIARAATEKCSVEKDIASVIKKDFDSTYGPTWHCIVGRNFGSFVTHETGRFIYFYVDHLAILLFKSELSEMVERDTPIIINADMNSEMIDLALRIARTALEKKICPERQIATLIKKEFDTKCGPNWHCIVGRSFGSFVTHEAECFIYFCVANLSILLFKSG